MKKQYIKPIFVVSTLMPITTILGDSPVTPTPTEVGDSMGAAPKRLYM